MRKLLTCSITSCKLKRPICKLFAQCQTKSYEKTAENLFPFLTGAIQHGVPTNVCRTFCRDKSPPVANQADTPKSAI